MLPIPTNPTKLESKQSNKTSLPEVEEGFSYNAVAFLFISTKKQQHFSKYSKRTKKKDNIHY